VDASRNALRTEVLQRRAIATLATQNADGTIHLTPVWFLYENEQFYVGTNSASRKARNIQSRPNVTIMVDVREPGAERGVAAAGTANIQGGKRVAEVVRLIQRRYLSEAALADPEVGPALASLDNIVLEIVPEKWTVWDMRVLGQQLFGEKLTTPGYVLPIE
jgi:PPOX class probable F420-dependent enzyme